MGELGNESHDFIDELPVALSFLDVKGNLIKANKKFLEVFETGPLDKGNVHFGSFLEEGTLEVFSEYHKKCLEENAVPEKKTFRAVTSKEKIIMISMEKLHLKVGKPGCVCYSITDITRKWWLDIFNTTITGVLEILNCDKEKSDVIPLIIKHIRETINVDTVAIRVREGGGFPYYLIENENIDVASKQQCKNCDRGMFLPSCLCGIVLDGRTTEESYYTKKGSFWINSFDDIYSSEHDKKFDILVHPSCNFFGYKSIALVPLKSNDEIVGLLQINDKKKGLFSPFVISLFEILAKTIGIALKRNEAKNMIKKSEQRLKTAFETSNTGFLDWDLEKNDLFLSPKLIEMLKLGHGYENRQSFDGSVLDEIINNIENKSLSRMFYKKLQGAKKDFSFEIKIGEGGECSWFLIRSKVEIASDDKKNLRLIAVFEDITLQKESAKEKEKLIDKLKNALEKSKEANKLKTEFLSIVTHEIRTPLSSMLGFSQLLLSDERLSRDHKENALYIFHSGQRLLNAINDIIEISMLEAGNIRVEHSNIDIEEIIKDVRFLFKIEIEAKNIDFRIDLNGIKTIYSDSLRVRQILFNLVGNAVKFTEKGSISLKLKKIKDGFLFEVVDTGIGIPTNMQQRIFESFMQAEESIHRRYEGLGLGLTIAKKLAVAIGGDIELESAPGKGSRFKFFIPVRPDKYSKRGIGGKEAKREKGKINILFAEDDYVNHLLIDKLLKREKTFGVKGFFNGKELLEYLRSSEVKADIVLLDISMPVMDGIECLKKIRKEKLVMPVLAMTAFASKAEKEKHVKMGFSDYITKPLSADELIFKLKNLSAKDSIS